MSCCDPRGPYPEDTVGQCPECERDIDKEGASTEECCGYSPVACKTCGHKACDWSC